jgi:HK97 family phage prohead protease
MSEHNAPEQRTIDVDVTDVDTRGRTLHGYAAVYGAVSDDLGGYREQIARGAFQNVIEADVRCLLNHDPSQVLGRTRSGTLRLADEQRGLRFECDLPDSPLGENVRAAVRRGDIDGASFRFVVGEEQWDGDLRTVQSVKELHDVTVATYGAYPDASVELRTRDNNDGGERRQEGAVMAPEDTGADTAEMNENETEERTTETDSEERTANPAGSLRVEERVSSPRRGLADEFRAAGFPGETAEISWADYEERAVTWTPSINLLDQTDREGVPLGFDQRYVWTTLPTVGVDSGVTSVQVLAQSTRQLPASGVIRSIDATTDKAEVATTVDLITVPLSGVAAIESGIPNVVLEQPQINTLIEGDLRLTVNEGLDAIVDDTFTASGNQAPGTDNPLISYRKALTTLRASGYSPDTLVLTPAADEAIDVMVSGVTGADADFIFAPGQFGPDRVFGLRRVVSKVVAAPVVLDSSAYAKLYASPARLASFEENSGKSNTSLVRLELHGACGVERQNAAVRIAPS